MKPIFLVSGTFLAFLTASPAADPTWWTTRGVKSAAPDSNLSPATIGQAKHMAAMALAELEYRMPVGDFGALDAAVKAVVNLDKPIPRPPDWNEKHHIPLLTGELKALAKPFYDHLRALDADWLDQEMIASGTRVAEPGTSSFSLYPWTQDTADDANRSPATLGQLKAVFALRFENLTPAAPPLVDSDSDGIPDNWELAHGLDPHGPSDVHGLFKGGPLTCFQAFKTGVQPNPAATLDDLDGDGALNKHDVAPLNDTLRWPRGSSPTWMVRFPDIPFSGSDFWGLSAKGVAAYKNLDGLHVITPKMNVRAIPANPPGSGSGFFSHPLSLPLHGDRVFGRLLVSSDPFETAWAYYDPEDEIITHAALPVNNPPEIIHDATNMQVSGVGGGFGLRADGVTPMFVTGHAGYFESNDNAVSVDAGGMRYWTYANGALDTGRLVAASATWSPYMTTAGSSAATVKLQISQDPPVDYHLVPGFGSSSMALYAAEAGGAFMKTTFAAPAVAPLNVTRQGWIIDGTNGAPRLWYNGHWHPFGNHISPRASDNAPLEILHINKARDTGIIAATARHAGDSDWKHAILTPIHLQIHHSQQNTTIPWNDYLPGYHLDEPMLCKAKDANKPQSFENLDYNGPQEIALRFSGPAIELADSISLEIHEVTKHPGWAVNAGDSVEEDFSFEAGSDQHIATAAVTINGTASIPIFCKDYAAWAKLRLTLKKNGVPIHPDPIILTLPQDASGDRIADHWQRMEIQKWNAQFNLSTGEALWIDPEDSTTWWRVFNDLTGGELADSDGDGPNGGPMPAMLDKGDDLPARDEYRGYFFDGGPGTTTPRHRRLSASRKELLVECSEMEGIASTTLRLPSDGSFIDQGNDPNSFAQGYTLNMTMIQVSSFFAKEGPPAGSTPKYYPGAVIDTWWVKDELNDMGYVVYENGAMGTTHKYSGPYKDLQRTENANRDRNGWLSIASDDILRDQDRLRFRNLYGGNDDGQGNNGGQGVAVLANYSNRNNQCRHFVKLAIQGRKGIRSTNGSFYAKTTEAAREQDESTEDRSAYQGSAIFVNSLSEESDLVDQAGFTGRLEYSIAHELGHLFILGRNSPPFDGGEHYVGTNNVMGGTGDISNISFHEDEIRRTNLRQRASINHDATGQIQP